MLGLPDHVTACLFDLDGVLTDTAFPGTCSGSGDVVLPAGHLIDIHMVTTDLSDTGDLSFSLSLQSTSP